MQLIGVDVRSVVGGASVPSGVQTVIVGPLNVLRYPTKTFTVYNLGPTTLSGVLVQANPDIAGYEAGIAVATPLGTSGAPPNAGLWETVATIQSNVPVGAVRSQAVNTLYRWVRLVGLSNDVFGNTITASGWLHATTV